MINVGRKYGLSAGKTIVLTTCRSFVLTPASSVRVMVVQLSPRQIPQRRFDRQLKDNEFTEAEEEFDDIDPNTGFPERDSEREIQKQKNKLWKILTKKKMEEIPRGPNMLTTSEREHMRYLHNSDPERWTPEELSKSFPALPYAIRKILKKKWDFEKEEDIKKKDAEVLENWEKFKRNELEAHPMVLRHLKKFVNRRETLKLQLDNPKFFPSPPIPKQITWKEGEFTKLLTKYERDIKKIQSSIKGENELVQVTSGGEVPAVNEKKISVMEKIKRETEKQGGSQPEVDSFVIGKWKKKDKEVTLEDMKKNIWEKTRTKKRLSKFEELVIDKTLPENTQKVEKVKMEKISQINKPVSSDHNMKMGQINKPVSSDYNKKIGQINRPASSDYNTEIGQINRPVNSDHNKKVFKPAYNHDLLESMLNDPKKEDVTDDESPRFTPWKSEKEEEEELEEGEEMEEEPNPDKTDAVDGDGRVDETRHLSVTDLGRYLYKREESVVVEEPTTPTMSQITKPKLDFYGTDKDKEVVEKNVDLLSGSCFWDSPETPRDKSKDALSLDQLPVNSSPHVSPSLKTYFTYDYPKRITIPKEKRKKGKIYRLKDCYYDDDGEFLYRVPGVEID